MRAGKAQAGGCIPCALHVPVPAIPRAELHLTLAGHPNILLINSSLCPRHLELLYSSVKCDQEGPNLNSRALIICPEEEDVVPQR